MTAYRFFHLSTALVVTAWVSLLVHAVGVGLAFWLHDPEPPAAKAPPPEPTVELVLVETPAPATPADEAGEPEQPTAYTDLPERLAGERPEQADFLALHDSRAADRLEGGEEDGSPGAETEGEFPQVDIRPQSEPAGQPSPPPPAFVPGESEPTPDAPAGSASPGTSPTPPPPPRGVEGSEQGDQPVLAVPDPGPSEPVAEDRPPTPAEDTSEGFAEWLAAQPTGSLLRDGAAEPQGDRGFDFRQLEQGTIGANVDLEGDFTLNTYEWNFAPWMHRFAADLRRSWIAPYAYRLGVIDGYTRIVLVVERDGRPSSLEIVETEGHESLHKASEAALRAFAPYTPLPPDFPEDQLVIRLGLHYPAWKR